MDTIDTVPLVGGSPAVDLVNSAQRGVPLPGESNHDYLQTPSDLLIWSERVGLIDGGEALDVGQGYDASPAAGLRDLRAVRAIREALYDALRVLLADSVTPDAVQLALDVLQQSWFRAAQRAQLDLSASTRSDTTSTGLDRRLRVGTDTAHLVVDRIAMAAVETLRVIDPHKLRQCPVEEGGCGWLFVDQSRNGSRRWCRMADCGTQVKSRRLTERRRESRDTSTASTASTAHAPRRTR
jgi:predicted RNA-binding Zn ribbon-like protein